MRLDERARFAQAVMGRDDTPLVGLLASGNLNGVPLSRRIAVHRNTFFGSLTEALSAAFPVVEILVGERFFKAMARAFIEVSPPPRPDLTAFGGALPDFIDAFEPAAVVPYLGDVARLEWARVEATFAAEAPPLDPARLAVAPDAVQTLTFRPHPATRLVASPFAIQSIWDAHQSSPITPVDPNAGAEAVIIVRPADRLTAHPLSPGGYRLALSLMSGENLAHAAEAALAAEPAMDLQGALGFLIQIGAFTNP